MNEQENLQTNAADSLAQSSSEQQQECCKVLAWLDARTGIVSFCRWFCSRPILGGPSWCNIWPSAILFTLIVQIVTGFILFGYYSPSAQTAWESVFHIQYQVSGGWLVRAIHHYAAQVLVALAAIYVFHLIVSGRYRIPGEFVFWTALAILAFSLGACLTGDLLAWDENSYSATLVRCKFLLLLPGIGDDLFKLAAGGPSFGHTTLTRFLSLHICVFAAGLLVLFAWNRWSQLRAEQQGAVASRCGLCRLLARTVCGNRTPEDQYAGRYWPDQFMRNAIAWLAVVAVVLGLVFWKGITGKAEGEHPGDKYGIELGAPADPDPARFFAGARPEWSFRPLYQLSNMFPGDAIGGLGLSWKIVPIFVIPSLLALIFLLMPLIGRVKLGHAFNVLFTIVIAAGCFVLGGMSYLHDARDPEYHEAIAKARHRAQRAIELAMAGIPRTGALTLLRNDPQTVGPELYEQLCASCHNFSVPASGAIAGLPEGGFQSADAVAPDLGGFASAEWIRGLLDKKQITSDRYFGNLPFKEGKMARFVRVDLPDLIDEIGEEEFDKLIAALAAEAKRTAPASPDEIDEDTKFLFEDFTCAECHRFYDVGPEKGAPDLTGYGSRQWLIDFLSNPASPRFYGKDNYLMPAYHENPDQPEKNLLSKQQLELLVDWMRGANSR